MPVPASKTLSRTLYPTALLATCALAWCGPTYATGIPGVRLPLLDPLGGGSLANAAWTWGPALGLSALAHLRLVASGAPQGFRGVPYVFLAASAALALPAWLLAPGMAATLLASFSKMTGLLLLGFLALGLAAVDDEEEAAPAEVGGAEVVTLVQPAPAPVEDDAAPVALAA